MIDIVLIFVAYIECDGARGHQGINIKRRYLGHPLTCPICELLEFFCVSHEHLSIEFGRENDADRAEIIGADTQGAISHLNACLASA